MQETKNGAALRPPKRLTHENTNAASLTTEMLALNE